MELTDALRIALPPRAVAEALDDGALLRASLENCESFERRPSGEYALVLTVPLGPLRGRYEIRIHRANAEAGAPPAGEEGALSDAVDPAVSGRRAVAAIGSATALSRTFNFKASAAGVGSLRGQIQLALEEDFTRADDGAHRPAHEEYGAIGGDGENGGNGGDGEGKSREPDSATRIRYSVWAALTGPLAELAPRQLENALHALAGNFFAEFSAVVEAKYGRGPNRVRPDSIARQHVFLRPISLAGLARRPATPAMLSASARRVGDTLVSQHGGQRTERTDRPKRPERRTPQVMPPWAWIAAFSVGAAVLYLLQRLE